MSQLHTFVFVRSPWAVRAARRKVRSLHDLPSVTRDEVELVISELVTTALLRGGGEHDVLEVSVESDQRRVVVEIRDQRRSGELMPYGVGAQLLNSLCESWGSSEGSVTASIPLGHVRLGVAQRHSPRGRAASGGVLLEARAIGRRSIVRPALARR